MTEPRQIPILTTAVRDLFPDAEWRGVPPDTLVGVADDSREVVPGGIFVAVVGYETDGHLFLEQAKQAGAALAVVDSEHVKSHPELLIPTEDLPLLLVADTRRAAAVLASECYAHPSRETRVHGITGTKGKTTTVHLLAEILTAAGRRPGVMGTLGIELGEEKWPMDLTTPGPIEFQRHLRFLVDSGATDVVCEVSAHAGALSRTAPVHFETVTYMNLSREHGEHFSPEAYLDAKLAIARDAAAVNSSVWGIGNARDPHTAAFLEPIEPSLRRLFAAFEEDEDPTDPKSDVAAIILGRSSKELSLSFRSKNWEREIVLPLVGRFNAENAAAAATIASTIGIEPDRIAEGLSGARPIPGRLERIDMGQDFTVVVDYAHAPQPAAEALACLRELTPGRLIGVMGAGGSRDRGKRPMIGEVLARDCDIALVTSDNPRTEDPLDIINDILVGVGRAAESHAEIIVESDRRKAIGIALEQARPGDTVAVLGKGHETYQIFKDKTIHFDDREVAREWLEKHGYGGAR